MLTASSVTVIALNPEEIGQLLIVDCSITSEVPNAENQKVGDSLILRCNLNTDTIRNFDINVVNFIWSSNNVTLRMANQSGRLQDHYVISQLNTSNNGQEYKCEAMIIYSTTPPITESGVIVLDLTGKIVIIYTYYLCRLIIICSYILLYHTLLHYIPTYPTHKFMPYVA